MHKHTHFFITLPKNPALLKTTVIKLGRPSLLLEELIFREKNSQGLRSEINGAEGKMKAYSRTINRSRRSLP